MLERLTNLCLGDRRSPAKQIIGSTMLDNMAKSGRKDAE